MSSGSAARPDFREPPPQLTLDRLQDECYQTPCLRMNFPF
jgi:hypothetical protein